MYDETFKDDIKGVKGGNKVYGVNVNGDVFVTFYGTQQEDFFLGNYKDVNLLPKNSYNWDLDNIPSVNNFHNWISEKMKDVEKFVETIDEFTVEFGNVHSLDDFKLLLTNYLVKAEQC